MPARPAVGVALALAVSACVPSCNPADPLPDGTGGDDDDSVVLTRSNHPSGYGSLGCFGGTCHADRGAGFEPDIAEHGTGTTCVDSGCHGSNGLIAPTLVTGRVFADTAGTVPEAGITVAARPTADSETDHALAVTDTDGYFALSVTDPGTYVWSLRDGTGAEVRSEELGMDFTQLDGTWGTSQDCGQCHGATEPHLALLR